MRQRNKGEALHDLRASLMIANKGQLRRKRGEELVNQASCLNLVTNAVILWNTVYMAEVVEQLKREGYPVNESDLAHVWPTRYEHVNVYGRYHFNIEEARLKRHGKERGYDRCVRWDSGPSGKNFSDTSAPSKARLCPSGVGPDPGSPGQAPGTECCVVIGNAGGEAYTGR